MSEYVPENPAPLTSDTEWDLQAKAVLAAQTVGRSVKSFGALGDGSTDDTAAFQAAADWSKETGSRVYVPTGLYQVDTVDVSGAWIEGVFVGHTSDSHGYKGAIIQHKTGATGHCFVVQGADETSYSYSTMIRNLIFLGRRESNRRNVGVVTSATSRTQFIVDDWPEQDADGAYASSPYFGLACVFNGEGRFMGTCQVQTINQSTGEVVLVAGSELYAYDTAAANTYPQAGWEISFATYTTETATVGSTSTVKRWDNTNAGWCAISLQGSVQTYSKIERCYFHGWHAGVRKGLHAFVFMDLIHARACTLGCYAGAFPGNGSDDFIGALVSSGVYSRDRATGDTYTEAEEGSYTTTYRQTYCGALITASAVQIGKIIAFDCLRSVCVDTAANLTLHEVLSDRPFLQHFFNNGASSISVGTMTLRGGSATQDGIAVSSGTVLVSSLVTDDLDGQQMRYAIRMASASGKCTVDKWIDLGGVLSGWQNTTDAAYARLIDANTAAPASGFPYTVTPDTGTLLVKGSGARGVTLPSAAKFRAGNRIILKDAAGSAAAGNITFTPASGTIDGAATLVFSSNYQTSTLVTDGTNWFTV